MTYSQTDCDAAFAFLALAEARERGQIQGGPPIDKVRCKAILKACARHGMQPRREAVAELLTGFAAVAPKTAHADPRCVDGTGTTHDHPPEGWLCAPDGSRVQRMCRSHAQAVIDGRDGDPWTFLPEP